MKTSEDNIDELIRQALTAEESEMLEKLSKEQNLLELVLANFQGKMKWLSMWTAFIMLVVFALAIYCLIEFLSVTDIREMMLWGAGMMVGLLMTTMLKIWHWMQMDKNVLTREFKRLELQIISLHKILNKS